MTSKTIIESFELELKTCVREVPGKRRVFKGIWNSQEVFVKIFEHPSSSQRHFQRELDGIKLFQEHDVLTPDLLWSGKLSQIQKEKIKDGSWALITKAIQDATSFDVFYEESQQKSKALKLLFKAVLSHHNAGFIQTDLHPGNFMVSNGNIYSLDGDALQKVESEDGKLANIALLIAQFPVKDHHLLMNAYKGPEELSDSLEKKVFNARAKRCQKYLKKVFRQCTEISHLKSSWQLRWLKKSLNSPELEQASKNPESLFPQDPSFLLKNGNTATVALNKIGDLEVVIKRNNFNKNFKTFVRRFRKSRSAISWENGFRLINYGLNTPTPVALIENKIGPALKQAYIITEKCDGPDALEYFSKNADVKLADQMIEIFKVFEKCQISHGDCKATNFIISHDKIFIIDLDAMKEHNDKKIFIKYFKKDLKRWMANWQTAPCIKALFEEKFQQAELSKYL